MRTRYLIASTALALLIAIAGGIAYAMLRSELRTRQDRTARYCSQVLREMEFYGEALLMAGPAESSRERLLSPERTLAGMALDHGYYYCLIDAGVDHQEASKLSLRLSLGMNAASVDDARQALSQAMERLHSLGY